MAEELVRLEVLLSRDMKGRVEEEAATSDRSASSVVRLALIEYLERREAVRPGGAGGPATEIQAHD